MLRVVLGLFPICLFWCLGQIPPLYDSVCHGKWNRLMLMEQNGVHSINPREGLGMGMGLAAHTP